jgi:hypothetical protein
MNLVQLQLARRIHHDIGRLPHDSEVSIRAGQIIHLLNALWGEEKRADVAEARLQTVLKRAAEENLETLLLTDQRSTAGPVAADDRGRELPAHPGAASANLAGTLFP